MVKFSHISYQLSSFLRALVGLILLNAIQHHSSSSLSKTKAKGKDNKGFYKWNLDLFIGLRIPSSALSKLMLTLGG